MYMCTYDHVYIVYIVCICMFFIQNTNRRELCKLKHELSIYSIIGSGSGELYYVTGTLTTSLWCAVSHDGGQ